MSCKIILQYSKSFLAMCNDKNILREKKPESEAWRIFIRTQLFRQRLSHKREKAYATMLISIMGRKSWLIEVHGVYQQEKRRYRYICLCCFSLCRWHTITLNQGPGTPITHNTFWQCRIRFCWTTFRKTAVYKSATLFGIIPPKYTYLMLF